jgi:predicted PolB exonuclease-like 3'-5' exonuclease
MFEGDTKASYLTWDDKQEDKKMIEKFTVEVLERPNLLVVGQNHKRFDYKVLAERSKLNRNTPMDLANIHTIDTLYSSRASFRSPSHKLDFRSRKYGLGGKRAMEFNDWVKIGNGDKKALAKMIKYGCKDVTDLRKIFWRELPYYLTLPAPIDKILRETATRCEFCAANKKASFNIKERYDGLFECLTCGDRWE